MKWRVVMELTGADGAVRVHEIGNGAAVDEHSPWTVGLTLAEGKLVLAGLQHHLVRAQRGGRPERAKTYASALHAMSWSHVALPVSRKIPRPYTTRDRVGLLYWTQCRPPR